MEVKGIVDIKKGKIGWLVDGFNVGLELRSELLSMVWDSSLRMVRRHAITIVILPGGDDFPASVPPGV